MRLLVAHKVLISTATALAVIMAVRGAVLYARAGRAGDLVIALGALALAVGLIRYLRSIWSR